MITREQMTQVVGHPVQDPTGKKIGEARHMYLDDTTGDPEWVTVATGLFGNNETFVPLRSARLADDHLEVPYDKDKVKGAPNVDVDAGGHLSVEEEGNLYRYYGLEGTGTAGTAGGRTGGDAAARGTGVGGGGKAGAAGTAGAAGAAGTAAAGTGRAGQAAGRPGAAERRPAAAADAVGAAGREDAAESMIRSEEEMRVRVERRVAGRARLHKYVDVEEVEKTVPVRQEEIRLEREPITDATRSAVPDSEITEAEQTVTLHEEQPVVDTRVVPKERVRIRVDEHTEQRTVRGRVRKERIETDMTEAEAAAAEKDRREPGRGRPDDRYR
jgi:stress response protein YsnF